MQDERDKIAARPVWAVWPALALIAFWLPLLQPLAQRGMLTCSHNGVLHLLRTFQLDTLVRQGVLWPRWLPGMVFGYGYPLFNFHPAASYYPVLIVHRLGLSLLQSWNLSLALGMLASGWTMYLWARQVWGERGGFVAAIAYMLAPYQLYDVYWRGSSAESLALPLAPLVMWAALRIAHESRWRYVSMGALAYAAVLLTHAPSGLMLTPVLLAYALSLVLGARDWRAVALRLAAMMILALGLAAFFLFPAFLERDQAQLARAITPGGQNFRNHFLSLGELFGPAPASDPLLVNPSPARSLGWVTSLLTGIGLVAAGWGRGRIGQTHKRHVIWASLTLLGLVVMMLPVSKPIWSHAPLLPFIQYPWRFLGVSSLLAALLAGAGVTVLSTSLQARPTDRRDKAARSLDALMSLWPVFLCGAMLALGALPWAYPRLCPTPENPTQAFYAAYEKSTGLLGTTSSAEYLPAAVQELPVTSPFVKPMRASEPVFRWDAPGARIAQASDEGLSAELVIESDAPTRVMYRAFYFPGWQARLDGQPIEIVPVPPLGLMAMDVPAGRHQLQVHFGTTPLRAAGAAVSWVTLLVVVAIWILDLLFTFRVSFSTVARGQPMGIWAWVGLIALGVALFALKLGVLDRYDTLLRWRRLQDNRFRGAEQVSQVAVAGRARLLGYTLHSQSVVAGEVVFADLFWTLDEPLAFRVAVRLVDEQGLEWSDKSELDAARGSYSVPPPSAEWRIGAYADDRHAIQVLPGTPPGVYWLVALPFDPETLDPLPISAGQLAPGGYPGAVLGQLEVIAPTQPAAVDALGLSVHSSAPLGTDLTLTGYSQDREETAPGQVMLITLGWQARRRPQSDYVAHLELFAPDGQLVMQWSLPPGGSRYPASRWRAGEVVRTQVLVHIPGRVQSGEHRWRVTLFDGSTPVGQATLGRLLITAPQRVFNAPAMSHQLDARLGDQFALVGFDAPARITLGQTLTVTLAWQALGETDQDVKVFIHLLDLNGRVVAQSDAMPAGWTRPTSGWQVGEYVTDTHVLESGRDLSPGEYRLVAGMYDSATDQRLPAAAGGNVVELGKVQIDK